MQRIGVTALALVCAMAAAAPVRAAETLDTVVVTAGRTEEKAANVTQAVTVIPREELDKHQYQDMGRLLLNYGVGVTGYSANEALSGISIRGMRTPLFGDDATSPILVLIDGRRAGTTHILSLIHI